MEYFDEDLLMLACEDLGLTEEEAEEAVNEFIQNNQ